MKEYFDGLMQTIGKVPTEFAAMNETQKLILSIIVGLLVATWVYNITKWYLTRRAKKVPFEKGDPAMDLEIAEEWHDFLINRLNAQRITEQQYKRYVRFLKVLSTDVIPGTWSTRVRDLIKTQRNKRRISYNLLHKIHLPTLGYRIFEKKVRELISPSPVKRQRYTRTKS